MKSKLFYISTAVAIASAGIMVLNPTWFDNFFVNLPDVAYAALILGGAFLAGKEYNADQNKLLGRRVMRGVDDIGYESPVISPQFKPLPPPQEKPITITPSQLQKYKEDIMKAVLEEVKVARPVQQSIPQESSIRIQQGDNINKYMQEQEEERNPTKPEKKFQTNEDLLGRI